MKQKTFLLLLLFAPLILSAQSSAYAIQVFGPDSIFLTETKITPTNGGRPNVTITNTRLYTVADFTAIKDRKRAQLRRLDIQIQELSKQRDQMAEELAQLEQIGQRQLNESQTSDPVTSPPIYSDNIPGNFDASALFPATSGFWIVYPTKGTKVQFVQSLEEIRGKALILNPNGTTMEIKNGKQ